MGAKTSTSGKIFGSVTSLQIARAIRDQKGYEIDRKRIVIAEEVKELGTIKQLLILETIMLLKLNLKLWVNNFK